MLLALRILLGSARALRTVQLGAARATRPVHARGQANGLIAAGQALASFGTLVGGLVMRRLAGGRRSSHSARLARVAPAVEHSEPAAGRPRGGGDRASASVPLAPQGACAMGCKPRAILLDLLLLLHIDLAAAILVKAHGYSVPLMAEIGAGVMHSRRSLSTHGVGNQIAGSSPAPRPIGCTRRCS